MRTIDQIIQDIEDNSKNLEFLPTGFPQMDVALDGGFMKKELIILGGFTGLGKSYLAGQIMWNIVTAGYRCAYFSLEISDHMIISRLVGSLSNIKPTRILKNKLDLSGEKEKSDEAKLKVITYGDLIDVYDDVYEMFKIGKAIIDGKYDFVIIDFLQNVVHRGEEYERLSAVSLYFQRLAKQTNSCIMALSQLSNSAARTDVVEYKGSGSIAMVCDLGFFLNRDEAKSQSNDIILSLRKNRRGFSGVDFKLEFQIPGGKIYEKK